MKCVDVNHIQSVVSAGNAQLNISPSSSTPCYGDVVTLVCHHPELATNPGRYLTRTPEWRENGVGITPSDGTMFEANTSPDSTSTTLNITITVDHFRNKSFDYSCFLVLAGASAGQLETSPNVTVDPIGEWCTAYMQMTLCKYNAILHCTVFIAPIVFWIDL